MISGILHVLVHLLGTCALVVLGGVVACLVLLVLRLWIDRRVMTRQAPECTWCGRKIVQENGETFCPACREAIQREAVTREFQQLTEAAGSEWSEVTKPRKEVRTRSKRSGGECGNGRFRIRF